MKKEDSLHQLISNLDRSEKRLFKIFAKNNSQGSKLNYVELFDVLAKMDVYDESILKKKIKSENTLKHLAQSKKYLKGLILKSMCALDEKTPEGQVNDLLKQANFLSKKNLFNEKWKKLIKAKEIAEKYELFEHVLKILDKQMSHLIEQDFDKATSFYQDYKKEKQNTIKKIDLLSQLYVFNKLIFLTIRKKETNEKILNNLFIELNTYNENNVLKYSSFQISDKFYDLSSNYFFLTNENDKLLIYREKQLNLYDKHKHFKNNGNYIIVFFNYLSSIFRTQNFDLLAEKIELFESIDRKNINNEGEYFQDLSLIKVLYFLNTGKLNEAYKSDEHLKTGIKKYKKKINDSTLLTICYNYSLVYFLSDDFNKCIEWIQEVYLIKSNVRKDLISFVKVIEIICHYEMENLILLESLIRSFKRNNDKTLTELKVVQYITKLSNSTKSDKKSIFESIETFIQKNTKYIVGKDIYTLWLKAKINKKDINQVYNNSLSS